jgi:outer membrane protein assembly factor BamA
MPRVVVDNVVFDGTVSLPASVRDQVISDLTHRELPVDSLVLEEWNEIAIRGAWHDQGFFKMSSTVTAHTISENATERHISVTVHVQEGVQYHLSEIRFRKAPDEAFVTVDSSHADTDETTNNSRISLRRKITSDEAIEQFGTPPPTFPLAELRKSIPLNDGDVFGATPIRDGLDALKHLYTSQGYIEFVATPMTEVDDESRTISVMMELIEGKQFHVRTIEVQGLDPQTKSLLKWRIQPGDVFNEELFKDFFADNKDLLPAGASPENANLTKSEKYGTVDIRIVLHPCP